MTKSSEAPKSKLVKPENTLKKKVGNGGFDAKVLESAQDMIENNTIDFQPIALEFSESLTKMIADARSGELKNEDVVNSVMYPAMQLKAQGTLFHYPLITKISHIMVDFLEDNTVADADIIDIVEAYKKSITAVATLQIKEENSKVGKELCDALTGACNRYYKARAK